MLHFWALAISKSAVIIIYFALLGARTLKMRSNYNICCAPELSELQCALVWQVASYKTNVFQAGRAGNWQAHPRHNVNVPTYRFLFRLSVLGRVFDHGPEAQCDYAPLFRPCSDLTPGPSI